MLRSSKFTKMVMITKLKEECIITSQGFWPSYQYLATSLLFLVINVEAAQLLLARVPSTI